MADGGSPEVVDTLANTRVDCGYPSAPKKSGI